MTYVEPVSNERDPERPKRMFARISVLASVPVAFVTGSVVPLSSATEYLFFPILIGIPTFAGYLLAPAAWPAISRGRLAADAAIASVATAAALFALGLVLYTAEPSLKGAAASGVVSLIAYIALATRVVSRSVDLRRMWTWACIGAVAAGGAILVAAEFLR